MARRTSYVADGVLHIPGLRGDLGIGVGSESWAAWLTDPVAGSQLGRAILAGWTPRPSGQ